MRHIIAFEHHRMSPKRRIEIYENDTLVMSEIVNPGSAKEVNKLLTKPHRIPFDAVVKACAVLKQPVEIVDPTLAASNEPLVIYIRPREAKLSDPRARTVSLATLADFGPEMQRAEDLPPDAIVEWDDLRLSYIDIDTTKPFHSREAERIAALIQPSPVWWHQSRSGGMHLYYLSAGGFEARDLAAIGAAWILQRQFNGVHRVELKRVTRHPAQTGNPWRACAPSSDLSHVLAWLRCDASADPDTESVLAAMGWEIGQRFPHTECPIDPRATSKGDNPVVIMDRGVYCHVCAGLGQTATTNGTEGFVPYSHWVSGGLRSHLQQCVKNLTHWSHARVVFLQQLNMPELIAKACYRVMLSLWHGRDDPRLESVFTAGDRLYRRKGYWQFNDNTKLKTQTGKRILAALPAVQNSKGEVIGERLDLFTQECDLSDYGYAPLDVVHGVKIWGHKLEYNDNRIATVAFTGPEERRPRYLTERQGRLGRDETRKVYEKHFPRLPYAYLQLLIAARGIAEGGQGMPPFVYCWGSSGAGKTQTIHLAASTIGERATEVPWDRDNRTFRMGILDCVANGTYCVINEIRKSSARVRMSIDLALEPLLNLTADSVSHLMYHGPAKLGRVPVVVMTETTAPMTLLRCEQLVRRLVNVRLTHRLAWDTSVGADVARFREISAEANLAANSLLSWIIDDFFSEPLTFFEIAEKLGFEKMEDYAADETNIRELLIGFFHAVCNAPEALPVDQQRWGGRGWRVVNSNMANKEGISADLDSLYLAMADAGDFTTSTRLLETDWSALLGLPPEPPVECQIKPVSASHRNLVGLRFRCGHKYNGEILADANGDTEDD